MASGIERAINFALRVQGVGEVERDFRKVGAAGEQAFEKVEKHANDADKAMSEYTARLKRVAAAAREAFDTAPGTAENRAADPAGYIGARNKAILDRVEVEKRRIQEGLPDMTGGFGQFGSAIDGSSASLLRFLPIAAAGTLAGDALRRAIIGSAEAYMEHERALDSFAANLALAGNQSQASGQQIIAMAERIVAATLQTEESALRAAQVLATVPGITAAGLEAALDASARLADALGTDVADQAEQTAEVLRALAERDMRALVDATKGLNPQLHALVLQLAEAGRTADAQRAYLDGLRQAAGDGPDGLTTATNRLGDAWTRMKIGFAEDFSGPAATALNGLASLLENFRGRTNLAATAWNAFKNVIPFGQVLPALPTAALPPRQRNFDQDTGFAAQFLAEQKNRTASAVVAGFEKRYGSGAGRRTGRAGGAGGRSGQSDAAREADRLKREAEQARSAADRIAESNLDIVLSYQLRAKEAEEKLGLEGGALKAVERRHALEAIMRRLNTEEIDKEVEARRAAALAAGKSFDAATALDEATEAAKAKSAALRDLAERELDAADASAAFARSQAQAKVILEQIKSPIEQLNEEVERAIESLRDGAITADDFNRRMDQLAEGFADVAYEADKGAQAWQGFGHDVGRSLADIALNGGSARDILQQLISLPLDRLLEQNIVNPVADFIDGLTGNNREKNVATARDGLPDASKILGATATLDPAAQGAAISLTQVQTNGIAAAQALQAVALSAGNPIDDLAASTDQAALAMGQLTPATAQFGSALANVLSQLAGGGGGGGSGLLGSLLQIGIGLASGGAAPQASLVGSASAAIAANPGLFASGTDRLPVGKPFWVGENGRELLEMTRGGGVRVHSNQQAHRMMERPAGATVNQTINIPARADPRRTQSSVARGTQVGLARATRKGIAAPAGNR